MAYRFAHESLFVCMLGEEEHAVDIARSALQEHKLSKRKQNIKPVKRLLPEADSLHCYSPTKRLLPESDSLHCYDGSPIIIKSEESESRKRKKGGRSAEDYLQKGGMMAFYRISDFQCHFGLSRLQVEELFTELQPHYRYERGSKLPLENVVLASLRVLCSQESYRIIAERFQTSKSVICTSLHLFCNLVSGNLENRISWPSGPAILDTVRGFEEAGFPGTIGAIDACRIAINKPKDVEDPEAYMNEKNIFCTTLLAVCDNEYKFTYVNVGHPGTLNDADIFNRCELFEAFKDDPQSLLPREFTLGSNVYTYHIIADAGFPLSEYVLTPHEDVNYLTGKEELYNRRHLSALMSITRTFGLLKGRFSRLKLLQMQHLAQCSVAIKACCILHNICIENSDLQVDAVNIDEDDIPPPTEVRNEFQPCVAGEEKRIAIADSLM